MAELARLNDERRLSVIASNHLPRSVAPSAPLLVFARGENAIEGI